MVNAQALLPDGPYNLWREGEQERPLNWIVGSFAEFAHLPKFLDIEAIRRTMLDGVRDGLFVMRLTRPDRSIRTFWCEEPEAALLRDPTLTVVLSEYAELCDVPAPLLGSPHPRALEERLVQCCRRHRTVLGRSVNFYTDRNCG
jgi:hypothetical protein